MISNHSVKLNLKIFGKQFREHRINKGYSLRGIARSLNIAHTIVSDIENGKIYPSADMIKGLFKQVDIDFLIDEKVLRKAQDDIDRFNEAIYFRELEFSEYIYRKYQNHAKKYHNSLLSIEFKLMEILYQIVFEDNYEIENLEKLAHYYPDFTDSQKERFNLLIGHNLHRQGNISGAKKYLTQNLDIHNNAKVSGISASLLAECSKRLFHAYDAIDYGKKASELHAEQANLLRKVEADALVINILIDIQRFQEAQNMMNTLTMTIDPQEENTKSIRRYLHFLQSYLHFRKKDYRKAYDLLSNEYESIPSFHFYQAEILLSLGNVSEAEDVLRKSLTLESVRTDPIYFYLNSILLFTITQNYNEETLKAYHDILLKRIHLVEDFPVFKHIFLLIVEYYQKTKKYAKALEIALKYINYPQNGYEMHQKMF